MFLRRLGDNSDEWRIKKAETIERKTLVAYQSSEVQKKGEYKKPLGMTGLSYLPRQLLMILLRCLRVKQAFGV